MRFLLLVSAAEAKYWKGKYPSTELCWEVLHKYKEAEKFNRMWESTQPTFNRLNLQVTRSFTILSCREREIYLRYYDYTTRDIIWIELKREKSPLWLGKERAGPSVHGKHPYGHVWIQHGFSILNGLLEIRR